MQNSEKVPGGNRNRSQSENRRGRGRSTNWRGPRDENSGPNDSRRRRGGSPHPKNDRSIVTPNEDQNGRGNPRDQRRWNRSDNNYNSRSASTDRKPYGNDDRQNPRKVREMRFRCLEELLKKDNLEEIIFVLNNDRRGFKELLESRAMSNDMIVLVLQLLCRICECSFRSSKIELFESALRSAFADNVVKFVSTIAVQTKHEKRFNSSFWKDTDQFWNNIILVARHLHDIIPTSSCEVMAKLLKAIKLNIPIIESSHSIHISETIKNEVEQLFEIVEKTSTEVERKKEIRSIANTDEDLEPPDDFREISVYPSALEVTHPESPFLRANVTKGPYRDVDHYLDVQFRLLREDFVAPLRKAICRYMKNPKDKLDDVKIYKQIQFLNMETVTEENCFRIQYDFSKTKKSFQYENSRRFMFGALLCFTSDNFKTILFGKVVKRDVQGLLENGQIVVGFSEDVIIPENIYDLRYVMVESTVYFEPYYRVLNVLKTMQQDYFPMERYIIRVKTTNRPPDYLLKIDPQFYNIESDTFWPLDWGERRFYGLNDSQNEAFKAALTKEFSIIQGPPGTGKTFLGLKIAHTLLYNRSVWYKKTPILVICYTNHALDQFLEGLLPVTEELIRVGGQSKNEKLNNFNLRNKRYRGSSNAAIAQRRHEVHACIQEIEKINKYLCEIEKNKSVVEFGVFRDVVPNFRGSWFDTAKEEDILKWLFSGGEFGNRNAGIDRQMEQRADHIREANEGAGAEKEEEEVMDVDDIFDEHFEKVPVTGFEELISIKTLSEKLYILSRDLRAISADDEMNYWDKVHLQDRMNFELYRTENELGYLQMRLAEGVNNRAQPLFFDLMHPHYMSPDDRWQMYFSWLDLYIAKLRERKEVVSRGFRKLYSVYSEMRDMEDAQVMKDSLVVGMTTTGAARLQSSLQTLKSPIVIVEEAAEVLEAHIISSLTSHCKHLILIGDHQQLKPSTANFKIETKYRLGISLFERMVINRIQCHTLNIQHRMRPEVSCLIRPTIYPVLEDHESVKNRPQILGIENCVYFLDHQEKEQVCKDNSKKNVHEAQFLIRLARHLILNGYKPEDITILAAYLGQMFEMQREKKLHDNLLQDVRIAVLDNYQGEESNIILLSLVRSNDDNKIGFLKTENRVCVALSRARNGFYIMGNMEQLCNSSEIWPKIREALKNQDAIGPHLTLRCQIHRERISHIKKAADFSSFIEGGCDLKCEAKLGCGHFCKRLCHVEDKEHVKYMCREKCVNTLCDEDPTHICQKFCYEDCGLCTYLVKRELQCGHSANIACHVNPSNHKCTELVVTILPCKHEAEKPCHMDPKDFRCPHPCDSRVEPCGHSCKLSCHVRNDPDHLEYQCSKKCERYRKGCTLQNDEAHLCPQLCYEECPDCVVGVMKKRTKCNHHFKIACNQDVDLIECQRPCAKPLPCGHKCKRKCEEPCGNCNKLVEKTVPDCNHTIKIECALEPDRKYCKGKCPRLLPCGHVCLRKCNVACTTECKEIVDCSIRSPCGHVIKRISCYLKNTEDPKVLLQRCSEPCAVKLKCEHVCQGTCGECTQGRIHKKCQENCGVLLVCNHECPIPCRQACKPCLKPCEYRCKHSKCKRSCGDPCTFCKEPCGRNCEHQKCTRKCGQQCNVPPCTEPCKKKLKCGHACVGFCGDRCPILCKICDEEELTSIFLGNEDEEDAVYVMLEDCKHVFESSDLERWLMMDENEIKAKVCPKCKTSIKTTARYSNYVRRTMEDITKVKRKFFGDDEDNRKEGNKLLNQLEELEYQLDKEYAVAGLRLGLAMSRTVLAGRNQANQRTHLDAINSRARADKGPGMNDMESALVSLRLRLAPSRGHRRQTINSMDLNAIKSKVQILAAIIKLFVDQDKNLNLKTADQDKNLTASVVRCAGQVSLIVNAVMRDEDSITDQEIEDITLEIDRLTRLSQFEYIKTSAVSISREDVKQQVSRIADLLETPTRYSSELDKTLKSEMEKLKKLTASAIQISDAERIAIVKAMGLSPGHWYKCPNGHPYAIADCGGAVLVSKCNECGVAIGGTNHRLLPGQTVATEMDGARHPAWSEAANMRNYMF